MLSDPATRYGLLVSRAFPVLIFLLNGFGVIDQSRAAQEMAERGMPAGAVPFLMMGGRIAQIVAGVALLVGFRERWAALVLFLFLIPATAIAHNFWPYHGAELQAQLVNFNKNVAILGGLLFIVCREDGRDDAMTIHQDVDGLAGQLESNVRATHKLPPGRHAWLHVISGHLDLNGIPLAVGDGAALSEEDELQMRVLDASHFLVFDLS